MLAYPTGTVEKSGWPSAHNSVSKLVREQILDNQASIAARETSSAYIPGFDGLRAIAVTMVLVAHAGYGNLIPGGFGVTVFFAISGFLITTLLLKEFARTDTINLKLFYTRRLLRLYPELILLIILCLVSGAQLGLHATIAEKLAGLFYFMNYYYVFGAHYSEEVSYPWRQLWSLAIEEHFYFFFPATLLFIVRTMKARFWLIGALVVVPFIWRFIAYYTIELPWQYNYVATDTRIDSIAWGCLLALLMFVPDGKSRSLADFPFIGSRALAAGLMLILASLLYRDEGFRWTWRFSVQGVGVILVFANLLFDPRWSFMVRLLEWGPIRYLGRISYGLYLYHMLVNRIILKYFYLTPVVFLALSLFSSFIIATISFYILEVPLQPLRRRLGSHVR